ncbi:MAG: nucleotidyltransferase domain-containing protein [Planctomycetota bacterium]
MATMRQIKEFAALVAREFRPQRIILFGSYAYGRPGPGSDVDLLVVMPFRGNGLGKAVEIETRVPSRFPLDLVLRTPRQLQRRLALNDFFLREIVEKGKLLYEAPHARMG